MGFIDSLGSAWHAVKDTGDSAIGVAADLAKAAVDSPVVNNPVTRFMVQPAVTAGEALQYATNKGQRAISTWEILNSGALGGGFGGAPSGVPAVINQSFHGKIDDAWKMSRKVTPGQAAVQSFTGPTAPANNQLSDLLGTTGSTWDTIHDYGERGDDKFSPWFSLASGTADAALLWYADPLVVGGKGVTAVNRARTQLKAGDLAVAEARQGLREGEALSATRRQVSVANEIDDFAAAVYGKPVQDLLKYKAFSSKTNNQGAALASLMSQADTPEQAKLIWLTAQGSRMAKEALVAQRADIGFKVDRLTSDLSELVAPAERHARLVSHGVRSEYGPAPAFSEETKKALEQELKSDTHVQDLLDRALGDTAKQEEAGRRLSLDEQGIWGSTNRRAKATNSDTRRAARSSSYVVQSGLAGVPMRVLKSPYTRRPFGGFDLHDAGAAVEQIDRSTKRLKGFAPEERAHWIGQMSEAQDDNARALTWRKFEQRQIEHIGDQSGLTKAESNTILKTLSAKQGDHIKGLKERNFGVADDGTTFLNPWSETQLANFMPALDTDRVEKVLARNAKGISALRAGMGAKFDVMEHAADQLNDLWKFGVLFRGGYMQRNVIDGQLRLLATIHGREAMLQHRETYAARKAMKASVAKFMAEDETLTKSAALKLAQDERVSAGLGRSEIGGRSVASPYGESGDEMRIIKQNLDPSDRMWASMAGDFAAKKLNEMRGTGDWITYHGDHGDDWTSAYLRTVNNHLREGEISKKLLAGESPEDVTRWLKSSDGRAVRRRLVHGYDSPEDLVQTNVENINHLIPEEMRSTFLERNAKPEDVEAMWPIKAHRPPVNAEQTAYSMGRGKVAESFDNIRAEYFRRFNSIPDSALSQHPMYRAMYRGRMRQELARLDTEGALTTAEQRVMEAQARTFARHEMRRLSFDASNKSNLGHFLRFTSPFYTAWEDVLLKYGRMVMDDPTLIPHAWQVWSSPNDASFLETVDLQTHKPVTGEKSQIGNKEGVVLWHSKLLDKFFGVDKGIVSKGGFNVVLQGDPWYLPGAGPVAQASLQDIAVKLDSPKMAGWLEKAGILPFGVKDMGPGGIKYFEPAVLRAMHPSDKDMGKLGVMIATSEEYRRRTGERKTPVTAEEVHKKTWLLQGLKGLTGFMSPASVQYQSPYQFYVDQYHAMLEDTGPGHKYKTTFDADEAFYKKYGDDAYLFSTSMSENNAKIAPTRGAYSSYKKVKDLVAKHPEFGDFFIGPNNQGTFDRNVYALQTMKKLDPVTNKYMRDTYDSPLAALAKTNAETGWNEYTKMTDQLEAARMSRGLRTLQSKGAEDLLAVKSAWIAKVHSDDGPAWGKDWFIDFRDTDGAKTYKFLLAARDATKDKRLATRPDVKTMSMYLQGREEIRKILLSRGSKALPSATTNADGSLNFGESKNADIAQVWAAFGQALADRDLTFATSYTRYLERDTLQDGV